MVIRFGLELDGRVYPEWTTSPEEIHINCGLRGLLNLLEQHLGLSYRNKNMYLRTEQYRQVIQTYLTKNPDAFYAASYTVDALATAEALLERRDVLFLANWDFNSNENTPNRLKTIAELEHLLLNNDDLELDAGFAERYIKVEQRIAERGTQLTRIYLNEPMDLLPPYLRRLFGQLRQLRVQLILPKELTIKSQNNLNKLQGALLKQNFHKIQQADESLVIVRGRREVDIARYLAQVMRLNPTYQPLCLVQNKERSLDTAMVQEGLPSMGLVARSSARPNIQILKLVASFLWKPINPYKILEFVSLPQRPLHDGLSERLANVMARRPGIFSAAWRGTVRAFFENFDKYIDKAKNDRQRTIREKEKIQIQEEYQFWFNRRRYDAGGTVPRKDVIQVFDYVEIWAIRQIEDVNSSLEKLEKRLRKYLQEPDKYKKQLAEGTGRKEELLNTQQAFQSLFEQARRLIQVLEALPSSERNLTHLQLDRLVKTIQEPTSMLLQKAGAGHLPYVYEPSAITEDTEDILWWNFSKPNIDKNFPYWYPKEAAYLNHIGLVTETVQEESDRRLWQRMQPILRTRSSVVLVMPALVEGRVVHPHPLLGDIQATCVNNQVYESMIWDIDTQKVPKAYAQKFKLPNRVDLEQQRFQTDQAYLKIKNTGLIQKREKESFSSLDQLFYYPYKWFFKHIAELNKSAILSVVKERTMLGNLAHTVFELLFEEIQEAGEPWNKQRVQAWVEQEVPPLFEREGAVLLMYGKEPERINFLNQLKRATWALVRAIHENKWKIKAIEHKLEGNFVDQAVTGILDLVLEREGPKGVQELAVVDLKWGGLSHRKELIKNQEDLQLVLYSNLLVATEGKNHLQRPWASTAFFIIDQAKLIARTNDAFQEAEAIDADAQVNEINHGILKRMQTTYAWRMAQVEEGKIEIRTEQTLEQLEEELNQLPMEQVLDMLEMKQENAHFDHYRILVDPLR
ncbi:MAG: PD-(D/E)XK nuclease family protein [Saprospiraceae bacterium]|nr:PD-(D/E)XK nuclease family protein [Saprospiraceae bacterium]